MDVKLERCAYVRDSVPRQAAEAIDRMPEETQNRFRLANVGTPEEIIV
jgi:phage terminase Nu1 subunit (DNA packaging protein)